MISYLREMENYGVRNVIVLKKDMGEIKMCQVEVYSRVIGYIRPVSQFNIGKKEEFKDRTFYKQGKDF